MSRVCLHFSVYLSVCLYRFVCLRMSVWLPVYPYLFSDLFSDLYTFWLIFGLIDLIIDFHLIGCLASNASDVVLVSRWLTWWWGLDIGSTTWIASAVPSVVVGWFQGMSTPWTTTVTPSLSTVARTTTLSRSAPTPLDPRPLLITRTSCVGWMGVRSAPMIIATEEQWRRRRRMMRRPITTTTTKQRLTVSKF